VKPWDIVGRARTPDGTVLTLKHHDGEYAIVADGRPLMSSRMHGSEEALAAIGCEHAALAPCPEVLIGGLGMGFTLRATLDMLPASAIVVCAELIPAVVDWNRGPLGPLAHHPLADRRVRLQQDDVADVMRSNPGRFDAVLLDVDNGPAAVTSASNAALYSPRGVAIAFASLKPRGMLAVWSANDAPKFEARLRRAGFHVETRHARGHLDRGPRHTILVARRAETAGSSKGVRLSRHRT
jgi:spermidine synthase